MKIDKLKQYVSLKAALEKEKADLETRLQQIKAALYEATEAPPAAPPRPTAPAARRRAGGMSLREAIMRVTGVRPLKRKEILAAVQKIGYRFATKDPLNSISAILYGKPRRFQNLDGKFSPLASAKTTSPTPASKGASQPAPPRNISPAGRARLSAAARARWAKVKASGGKSLKSLRKH